MAPAPSKATLALLASLLLAGAGVATAEPVSGRYGALALAVSDGKVHGVFSEGRLGNGPEDAPQFSCLFLLEGWIEGDVAAVETWFPGEAGWIDGTLSLGPEPALRLEENHGGCSMASGDMTTEPYRLFLDEPHPEWTGAGIVVAQRAVLRPGPAEEPARTHPYLVEFDAVAVLDRRDGWVELVHLDEGAARGWVREDEVTTSPAGRR